MGWEHRPLLGGERVDGTMRRIDYIRQVRRSPRHGLGTPEGDNPYEEDFGILPDREITRILKKHVDTQHRGPTKKSAMSMSDVVRATGVGNTAKTVAELRKITQGEKHTLGRRTLQNISRILLHIESGQLVKRDGAMVYLPPESPEVAEKARQNMTSFRVCIAPDGRVTIARGTPLSAPKQMPRLFADFKLPGE